MKNEQSNQMLSKKILPYIEGLHVLPWLTDGALDFLDSHIFYVKAELKRNPRVFEFGAGNSTLYFLSRGCYVRSVEHDSDWCQKIERVAECFGYESRLSLDLAERPYNLKFETFFNSFDLVLIDGRDRVKCLETVLAKLKNEPPHKQPILILDNTEHLADKYAQYLSMLNDYSLFHFEMPFVFGGVVTPSESRDGLNFPADFPANGLAANAYRDRAGNASKGRWITTIAVPKARGEFTSQGVPLLPTKGL
jgi:hypothetical protein